MDTKKIEKRQVRLIAHRGLSGIETENTNAAFVAAANRTYYGIETDIHRTRDGRFAISHDASLKRVSGEDVNIEECTLDELRVLTLFDKSGKKSRADLKVSSLEEYISICKKYEKHCVLELKSDFSAEEMQRIVDIIRDFDYLDNLTFISFKYSNLLLVRDILPTHPVSFLFSTFTEEIIEKTARDQIDIDVNHNALNREIIERLHSLGLTVNCWTVDSPERAEELIDYGIDFITTDILE